MSERRGICPHSPYCQRAVVSEFPGQFPGEPNDYPCALRASIGNLPDMVPGAYGLSGTQEDERANILRTFKNCPEAESVS